MPVIDTKDGPVFPGIWFGKVLQVDDAPSFKRVGKLKVEIPDVYGDNISEDDLPWAYPLFPGGINTRQRAGFFLMPSKHAFVGIIFERGDPQSPRWIGGWTQKGRIPFPFTHSEGDKFPHIAAWRGVDGMMIRFVEGERMEFFLGSSGDFDEDGNYITDGEHKAWDTFIIFDKKRKKVRIRLKYDVDIQCKGKVSIRAPQIRIRVMPNQQYNASTEDWENDPDSPTPTRWEMSVFDPDAQMGARIIAEPGKLIARARQVRGFKDR